MEQGEVLYAISQRIIYLAEQEMAAQKIPVSLRPLIMENAKAHFLNAAYDHLVALRIQEINKQEEGSD